MKLTAPLPSGNAGAARRVRPDASLIHLASACPLCAHGRGAVVSERDGKTGDAMRVAACAGCGFVRQDPLPTAPALATYYRDRYRVEYKGVSRPRLKHVWRAASLALEREAFLRPHVTTGARVLDVGAGGGEFVSLLVRRGYRASGIEPNRGYAEFARATYGIDVRVGMLDDFESDGERYDGITMFHVLEHVADPVETLRALRRRLSSAGRLVLEVPNVEHLRGAPGNMFFRAHVHYFSARTLLWAARIAGLVPVSPRPDPRGVNLRVALRADVEAAGAMTHAPSLDGLHRSASRALQAQDLRTWWRYLLSKRAPGRLAARMRQLRLERRLDDVYPSPRRLLDDRYGYPAPKVLPDRE
jgi:2-polyprenyl-3-methyl-5-hydroxy-6-metoxy-1,4-benzoquinol methylase